VNLLLVLALEVVPGIALKFKPICNNDVPVDTLLFGTDCTKKMKELGDYTKIPIGNPRFKSRRNHSGRRQIESDSKERVFTGSNSSLLLQHCSASCTIGIIPLTRDFWISCILESCVFACRLKADQISLFTLGTHTFSQFSGL
jgi:hypothetical protein